MKDNIFYQRLTYYVIPFFFIFSFSLFAHAKTFHYLQAEYAANSSTCGVGFQDSNHNNFTGTGFANCDKNTSAYIEWEYNSPRSGNHRLLFRFANGSGIARNAELLVNDRASSITMNATGTWDTWLTVSTDVFLNEGRNTIRLRGTTSSGLVNIDRMDIDDLVAEIDWGVAMAETTMLLYPKPEEFGWDYSGALAAHGIYQVYERTRDSRYLNYIKRWVDARVNGNGDLISSSGTPLNINNLDAMFATNLVLDYWQALNDPGKYSLGHRLRRAMQTMRNRYTERTNTLGTANTWNGLYPRTSDGGFWHNTGAAGQLWLDGLFMSERFLTRFGNQFGNDSYTNNEATKQILVTHSHLKDWNTGLIWHAFDEQGNTWTVPGTTHSQEFWCRAMGWFSVISVDTLETLPKHHPEYDNLLSTLQSLISALARYQDPTTGRWFQLVNRQSDSRNWTETSCSSMFAYAINKSIELGYVSSSFRNNADRAFDGVLQKVRYEYNSTLGATILNIYDVSQGTAIGNANYYMSRQRPVNDKHGLGSFMIMTEQFRAPIENNTQDIGEKDIGFCGVDGVIENQHSGWSGSGYANSNNAIGAGIGYRISVPQNGDYTFRWRYANGRERNSAAQLILDGQLQRSNIDFPATSSWNNWQHKIIQTYLSVGTHTLRLEATNPDGLPNIDVFSITGNNPREVNCGANSSRFSPNSSSSRSTETCSSIPQYVEGNTYNASDIVKNLGSRYQCEVAGWCTIGGPYAPGAGWAWDTAWSFVGACQ